MNIREKAAIRKNFGFLVQNIDVNSIKSYLFEKYILTQEDMEVLSMPNQTTSYRIEVLILHILPRRGENAFKEFVKALELDGHFSHVVEMLQNTLPTSEDIEKAGLELYGLKSDQIKVIHKEVDEMYEQIERRKSQKKCHNCSGGTRNPPQRSVSNQSNLSVGFDEPDGAPAYPEEQTVGASTLPEDTFEVLFEESEASTKLGWPPGGPYLLHISIKGIALILKCDFLETGNIQNCAHKTVWGFNVIRQFGHGDDRFVLEAGRKAPSGPGLFYFNTTNMQDGSQIAKTIKKYTDSIKNHNG